ncbi:MAG: hypothetical protein ACK5OB_13105 [Pirellula sp.]
MTASDDPLRVCHFCSLLCELPDSNDATNFGATFCSRREHAWRAVADSLKTGALASDASASAMATAREGLRTATDVLVTGRIQCLATARAVIRFARAMSATLDLWDSGPAMDLVLAIQRQGMHSVSLADARARTDLWIAIGTDRWLDRMPRLPGAMSRGQSVPMLLLGEWSSAAVAMWTQHGFDAISIPCPLQKIPGALAQAIRYSRSHEPISRVSKLLTDAKYTTVTWSGECLNASTERGSCGDLWIEAMLRWIAARNEEVRAGLLAWGSLEGTFQQACTWLTGFPGRVRFRHGNAEYRPHEFTAVRWLSRVDRQPARGDRNEGVRGRPWIVWVDDTCEPLPEAIASSSVARLVISPIRPTRTGSAVSEAVGHWLPCQASGIDAADAMFRGDQAVVVHGCNPMPRDVSGPLASRSELPSVAQWLARCQTP